MVSTECANFIQCVCVCEHVWTPIVWRSTTDRRTAAKFLGMMWPNPRLFWSVLTLPECVYEYHTSTHTQTHTSWLTLCEFDRIVCAVIQSFRLLCGEVLSLPQPLGPPDIKRVILIIHITRLIRPAWQSRRAQGLRPSIHGTVANTPRTLARTKSWIGVFPRRCGCQSIHWGDDAREMRTRCVYMCVWVCVCLCSFHQFGREKQYLINAATARGGLCPW